MKIVSKFFYLEFLIPLKDYFCSLSFKEFLFEWVIPLIVSIILFYTILPKINLTIILNFNGYLINALAILIGFSITTITILSTSSNKNIDHLKEKKSARIIDGRKISLYQLVFINFSFVLFIEFFAIIYNLLFYLIFSASCLTDYSHILFSINIFIVSHIVLLNIRNIANFYLIHWNDK